ncbi:MAG: DUF3098 domain-containing protein [Bacteroidia bacterium]
MKRPSAEKKHIANENDLALGKQNYILMLVGFGIIILGFILMIGDEDIYDFRKTVLATVVVIFGFLFEIYAIMKKPNKKDHTNEL